MQVYFKYLRSIWYQLYSLFFFFSFFTQRYLRHSMEGQKKFVSVVSMKRTWNYLVTNTLGEAGRPQRGFAGPDAPQTLSVQSRDLLTAYHQEESNNAAVQLVHLKTNRVTEFLGSGPVWPRPLVLCFPSGRLLAWQSASSSSLQSPRATCSCRKASSLTFVTVNTLY